MCQISKKGVSNIRMCTIDEEDSHSFYLIMTFLWTGNHLTGGVPTQPVQIFIFSK